MLIALASCAWRIESQRMTLDFELSKFFVYLNSSQAELCVLASHTVVGVACKMCMTGCCLHPRFARHAFVVWFKYFLFLSYTVIQLVVVP
jgi:hypothetical protein